MPTLFPTLLASALSVWSMAPTAKTPTPLPPPSFASQNLRLDEVLKRCLEGNATLRERAIDVAVSEATIRSALGQFDPQLDASASLSYGEQTPRGSTIVFSSGSFSRNFSVGLSQKVKTGGSYKLSVNVIRNRTDQLDFFNPQAGPAELDEFIVVPRLELRHPLLRGMGIKVNEAQIRQTRIARTQAQAQAQQAVQERVREVLFAYWDLAFAYGDLRNKKQAHENAQQLLEKTSAEIESGRLAPVEIKAVEQSLATREQAVLSAESQIFEQSLALRELMGDPMNPDRAIGITPLTPVAATAEELRPSKRVIAKMMKHHPQIRQLELALATRRIDELKALNDQRPSLDLVVGLSARGRSVDTLANPQRQVEAQEGSWSDAFRNFFNESPKNDGLLADYSVDATLSFAWDIRNRVASGRSQQAQQEILRAKLNLQSLVRTLRAAAIRTHFQQRLARKSLDVARLAVELAQVNLDAERARYGAGRSTNYDVLARIDELATAESQLLQAQIGALKARVEEQLLTGELLPSYGIELRGQGLRASR